MSFNGYTGDSVERDASVNRRVISRDSYLAADRDETRQGYIDQLREAGHDLHAARAEAAWQEQVDEQIFAD